MITSKNYDNQLCALVINEDKTPAKVNGKYRDFSAELWTLTGGRAPHKLQSGGFIWVKDEKGFTREFYPSVLGLKWILIEDVKGSES